jgi:hypothetical protein
MRWLLLILILLLLSGCARREIRQDIVYDEATNTITEHCVASSWYFWIDTSADDAKACGGSQSTKGATSNSDILQLLLRLSS